MDQVKIRAAVAAHGLAKDAKVTVAATPIVEGAISNGVFVELERYPADSLEAELLDALTKPMDGVDEDETPVPPIVEVQLPDAPPEDQPDEPATKPKGTTRRRG